MDLTFGAIIQSCGNPACLALKYGNPPYDLVLLLLRPASGEVGRGLLEALSCKITIWVAIMWFAKPFITILLAASEVLHDQTNL